MTQNPVIFKRYEVVFFGCWEPGRCLTNLDDWEDVSSAVGVEADGASRNPDAGELPGWNMKKFVHCNYLNFES